MENYPYEILHLTPEGVEETPQSKERQRRQVVERYNDLLKGRANWVGELTLDNTGSATTTTVEDERVTEDCEISLSPTTANAASMVNKVFIQTLSPGRPWTANKVGQFIVAHPIVSASDCTFRYSIKG